MGADDGVGDGDETEREPKDGEDVEPVEEVVQDRGPARVLIHHGKKDVAVNALVVLLIPQNEPVQSVPRKFQCKLFCWERVFFN